MTVLIAIAGGSGSGKSTLAEAVVTALPPGAAVLMREDWYYRDAGAEPGLDPARFDFDDVGARDHALLARHLDELKAGREIEAPVYSFFDHRRQPGGQALTPSPVVLVEGAHVLCTPALADRFDLRVYVDTPPDIRFIRRLLRDQAERGRTADSVIAQYLATVRPGHERLTEPSKVRADFIIADATAAVRLDDPDAVVRLAAPLLAHPLLMRLRGET